LRVSIGMMLIGSKPRQTSWLLSGLRRVRSHWYGGPRDESRGRARATPPTEGNIDQLSHRSGFLRCKPLFGEADTRLVDQALSHRVHQVLRGQCMDRLDLSGKDLNDVWVYLITLLSMQAGGRNT